MHLYNPYCRTGIGVFIMAKHGEKTSFTNSRDLMKYLRSLP